MLEKIISAIYLTFENTESLFEDAKILKEHKKFGRAYSLFHLCFEESGRFYLLYGMFMDYLNGKIKLKDIHYGQLKKLGFENHNLKISKSYDGMRKIAVVLLLIARNQTNNPELIQFLEKGIDDIYKEVEELRDNSIDLNELKNIGLYVTFENNEFRLPDKTITVSQLIRIEKLATISLGYLKKVIEFAESKGGFFEFQRLKKEEEE